MLSTFLSQLQTYFSKYFVIGSFCPMLAFSFMNGMTAYVLFSEWRGWVDSNVFQSSAGRSAFLTTSLVVSIVLAAYVLSSLSTFLRQLLEGRWWDPVSKLFIPAQNIRRQKLIKERDKAAMDIVDLGDVPQWEQSMRDSRERGRLHHPGGQFQPPEPDALESNLKKFERERGKDEIVPADDLELCAGQMAQRLE